MPLHTDELDMQRNDYQLADCQIGCKEMITNWQIARLAIHANRQIASMTYKNVEYQTAFKTKMLNAQKEKVQLSKLK